MDHSNNPLCDWPNGYGYHCSECCARIGDYENFKKHLAVHEKAD